MNVNMKWKSWQAKDFVPKRYLELSLKWKLNFMIDSVICSIFSLHASVFFCSQNVFFSFFGLLAI